MKENEKGNKDKKNAGIWIVIALLATLLLLIAVTVTGGFSGRNDRDELLELGNRYLNELDYEAAIAAFDKVLSIDPKCEEAYLGKAKAYYGMADYDQALETLELGISMADDPSGLQAFMQEIIAEFEVQGWSDGQVNQQVNQQGDDTYGSNELKQDLDTTQNRNMKLILNYALIRRWADTDNPEIQLEVISAFDRGRAPEEFKWNSSNEEVAQISETGLLTCQKNTGYATITVSDGNRMAYCEVIIDDSYETEAEVVFILNEGNEGENADNFLPLMIETGKGTEAETAQVYNPTQGYVYFSGDIVLPESLEYNGRTIEVTGVDVNTFLYTTDLETIRISSEITEFKNGYSGSVNPFRNCSSLTAIEVEPDNTAFQSIDGVLYSADGKTLIAYPAAKEGESFIIPEGVEAIYTAAFSGCFNLKEILVEESNRYYESIDGILFQTANNYLLAYPAGKEGTEYTMPENVTGIGMNAFYRSNLERIECGSQVTSIEENAFANCENLTYVGGLNHIEYIGSSLFNDSNNITGLGGGEGNRVISLYGTADDSIPFDLSTLSEMVNLESLEIPNRTSVGEESITYLSSLTSIDLRVTDLSDLSWLGSLTSIRQIQLECSNSEGNVDLETLTQLKGLTYLSINGYDEMTFTEEMEKQIGQIKQNNPECNIMIGRQQY